MEKTNSWLMENFYVSWDELLTGKIGKETIMAWVEGAIDKVNYCVYRSATNCSLPMTYYQKTFDEKYVKFWHNIVAWLMNDFTNATDNSEAFWECMDGNEESSDSAGCEDANIGSSANNGNTESNKSSQQNGGQLVDTIKLLVRSSILGFDLNTDSQKKTQQNQSNKKFISKLVGKAQQLSRKPSKKTTTNQGRKSNQSNQQQNQNENLTKILSRLLSKILSR